MNQDQIEQLSVADISQLKPEDLSSPAVLEQITNLANDPMYEYESGQAVEFYNVLANLVERNKSMFVPGSEIALQIGKIQMKLGWQALQNLGRKFREQVLQSGLVASIKAGNEPVRYLSRYLNLYELGAEPELSERQIFLFGLSRNQELVGNSSLQVKTGVAIAPTVANWIKDYVSQKSPNPAMSPSYDLTQYLFKNTNTQKLTAPDKEILKTILNLYDFLKYPKTIENAAEQIRNAGPVSSVPVASASKPLEPLQKPASALNQKLSSVATSTHGQDLEALMKRMQENRVDFGGGAAPKSGPAVKMTPDEIKRETQTKELPAVSSMPEVKTAPKIVEQAPKPKPIVIPASGIKSLNDIRVVDDLKKIGVENLRQGPIKIQAQSIKTKILQLAQANRLLPYYTVTAFEQSPLFQAYLAQGSAKVTGQIVAAGLNQEEFETVADLRKEIERL